MRNLPIKNLPPGSAMDPYEWLSAYIDNELSPDERQRVEAYLATNLQWQETYQRLSRLSQGFKGLQNLELKALEQVSPTPVSRISKRITEQTGLWLFGLAATVLGGLGLLFSLMESSWSDPVRVESPVGVSVAVVPSPPETIAPANTLASQPEANSASSGLSVVLDQPILALPEVPPETP